ncbi:anti-sigma factor [Jatrophihabitans sp. DSM 45814]
MSPELHALAGAYALDALDNDERSVFEEHLADCPDCAIEVESLQSAAAELSHITETTPPPALRADVLAAIGRVRPLPPVTDNVIALRRAKTSRSVWQVVAAACALIALVAAGWGYQQHRDAHTRNTASVSIVDQVLSANDATTVSGPVGNGRATLVFSKAQGRLVLVGHAIPAPGADKTYQLWMVSDGKYISAGTFVPDANGDVRTVASGDLASTSKMGISLEPAGGSPQPTKVIATMTL